MGCAGAAAAVAVAAGIPPAHILLVRATRRPDKAPALMFAAFALYALALGWVLWRWQPGVWPEFVAAAAMGGFLALGYMEAFSMLCRGFSLRIVTDIDQHGRLDLASLQQLYGGGRGAEWMLRKRMDTIARLGLVRRDDTGLALARPWGPVAARFGLLFKGLLNMGKGG